MKVFYLLVLALFSNNISFAQEEQTNDPIIASSLIGTWEHVSSTFPGGDIITFKRELQLFAGGKGICMDINEQDTVIVAFEWQVIGNTISLFARNNKGKRIQTDSQNIYFLSHNKMYLAELDGTEKTGKVCHYRKNNLVLAKI